jgi:AAA+ ATPase superfamily predicted ATPase
MVQLIGRQPEIKILTQAFDSEESEMVAVIGRRRVGKTFLVRNVLNDKIDLEFTGIQNTTSKPQIENFHFLLSNFAENTTSLPVPKNWLEAFRQLITVLENEPKPNRKRVLFFDELPWLASKKSGFLAAFGFFWNNWASKNNVLVIICGSAASWMIKRVVQNRGGLHNRITKRIYLKSFTLQETEAYFNSRNINLDRYQIAQIYMIMGGIPHYLKEVQSGKSAIQNIDDICFSEAGLLQNEFINLYHALFEKAENHIAIIRALGKKWKGLTRKEVVQFSELSESGSITRTLDELIHSGFVSSYYPFGKKKKEMLYRLTDEYSLFYLHFIENKRLQESGMWTKLSQTPIYKSWSGYAFGSLSLKHILQIKYALQIGGIYSENASFYFSGNDDFSGTQIDLLIDRNDNVINLCELKFYNDTFTITKEYADKLRQKSGTFKTISKTKKQIFITIISTFGLSPNKNSLGLIDNALDLDALFEKN